MNTTLTSKCQVTIPKKIRESVGLGPGNVVEFEVEADGRVLLRKSGVRDADSSPAVSSRFERMRGKATVKWRTDDLMALLRGE